MRIREAISTCIDVFENDKHPGKGLVDIFSGRIVDEATVNVHNSLQIGTSQWLEYERQWPAGFHKKFTKKVKTMAAATKQTTTLGKDTLWILNSFMHVSLELWHHQEKPFLSQLYSLMNWLHTQQLSLMTVAK